MRSWPDMYQELEEDKVDVSLYYVRHNSEIVYGPSVLTYNDLEFLAEREDYSFVRPVQIRKKFYTMLLRQMIRLSLKVNYDHRVERYFENKAFGLGGVMLQHNSIRVAHIVVAADAFQSRSERLVASEHILTRSSDIFVYRCPTES